VHRWNPRCCYRRCQCRFHLGITVVDFGAVVWFQTTLLGWYCRRWAGIVVVGVPAPRGSPLPWTLIVAPKPTLGSPRPNVVRYTGVGWRVGQLDGRKEGRKRTTTFIVVHCRDAPDGPPTTWVSLRVSPSSIPLSPPFPPSSEPAPPTSLWKGEGWTGPRFRMR